MEQEQKNPEPENNVDTTADFLDMAILDQIPDQTILENNSQHTFEITKAEIGTSSGEKTHGQKYLRVVSKCLDEEDARPVSDVFMLPFEGLDTETFNMRGRQLRAFLNALDFDYRGWNIFNETDALLGLAFEAVVDVEESAQYGAQNNIKKYL